MQSGSRSIIHLRAALGLSKFLSNFKRKKKVGEQSGDKQGIRQRNLDFFFIGPQKDLV